MKFAFGLLSLLLFSIALPTTSFAPNASGQVGDSNNPSGDLTAGALAAFPTDGTYQGILWSGLTQVDGATFGGFPGVASPWTMDCGAGSCWFTVVDGGIPLDQFEVFDFGESIGTTSVPSGDEGNVCGFDPDVCLADPEFSSGMFCLGPGTHSITMAQILNPGSGVGWIKAEINSVDDCGAVGGTFEGVNTTSLLVAGAQVNAYWILPLIAAIAIGVIVRKRF